MAKIMRMREILMIITSVRERVKIQLNLYESSFDSF